jgi:hypothetical protein
MPDFSPNQVNISSDPFTGNVVKQNQSPVFVTNSLDTLNTTPQAQQSNIDINKRSNAPTPGDTSNAIQQVFSKNPVKKNNGHELRNSTHKEFLQQNPFAVRLRSYVAKDTVVAFRSSPDINETRHIAYKTIDPLHMPGSIQVFQNSPPRSWSVTAIKLVSRNGIEAEENLSIINQLRAWQVPFFGQSSTRGREDYQVEMFGAPPEVLEFTAYSNTNKDGITNIRQIPVVLVSLTIPYPSDVDYIPTEYSKVPFPAIMTIDMSLVETHSPNEFSRFNLIDYKNGKLRGF